MKSLLEGMARYHAWASERLSEALHRAPPTLLTRSGDPLFGSIDQALGHLIEVDRLWYGRIAGGVGHHAGASDVVDTRTSAEAAETRVFAETADPAETAEMRGPPQTPGIEAASSRCSELVEQARRWVPLVDSLEPELFYGEVTFPNGEGVVHRFPLGVAVLRVFNQATHHRERLCAALAAAGLEAPELDMYRMLADGGWPLERDRRLQAATAVREACLAVALEAWEDAGMRGLCAEGRWEVAIGAIQSLDLRVPVSASVGTDPGNKPGTG